MHSVFWLASNGWVVHVRQRRPALYAWGAQVNTTGGQHNTCILDCILPGVHHCSANEDPEMFDKCFKRVANISTNVSTFIMFQAIISTFGKRLNNCLKRWGAQAKPFKQLFETLAKPSKYLKKVPNAWQTFKQLFQTFVSDVSDNCLNLWQTFRQLFETCRISGQTF